MGILNFFFKNNRTEIKDFLKRGAVIIDVRTELEWEQGHLNNAIHIPLSDLKNQIDDIKQLKKPVIAHCKSGVRSARATKLLKFYKIEAVNGGGIADLKRLID
ncbi:rhodanese-like domain-containing protein [Algibacter aquimarinus]|uniref:Rhodanese domain-containing protein n=1 Tax=Algibacter aquimarinus TaxID=1136748 RepID=A0ABP9H6D9_9FLAO